MEKVKIMKKTELKQLIKEILKESRADWMASHQGTNINLVGAHKWDEELGGGEKAEKIYDSIYKKLSDVSEFISQKIQTPTEIIVKFK